MNSRKRRSLRLLAELRKTLEKMDESGVPIVVGHWRNAQRKGTKGIMVQEQNFAETTWSVVQTGMNHGYAADIEFASSKQEAIEMAKDAGGAYVVKGTQMWNEPLGQVEQHYKVAPYRYYQ